MMQPVETRIKNVNTFLRAFKSGIDYEIGPIFDDYGPTGYDETLQAIVGSKETEKGCVLGSNQTDLVNEMRASKNLPIMKIFLVNAISESSDNVSDWSLKLSSSAIRKLLSTKQYS
jgi:pantetheine-phosphate adenylyltransferase